MSEPTPVAERESSSPSAPLTGSASEAEILTLPPIDVLEGQIPISAATGQPARDRLMIVGMSLLYAAALSAAVAFAKAWWDTLQVAYWPNSIELTRWADVRAGSWQSVILVVVMGLIGATMVAMPAITAFNAWNGHRWSRIAALWSIGAAGLAFLLNWVAWISLPLTIAGAVILWTPRVARYFEHWRMFRAGEALHPTEWTNVFYGPLPRYR